MKAIIFDVDGVIIRSNTKKKEVLHSVLNEYGLLNLDGVEEILALGVNRKLILDKIYKIKEFDKQEVLEKINKGNELIENTPEENENIVSFIKNNFNKYKFFTNTALPKVGLDRVFKTLNLDDYFVEKYAYENGTKKGNVEDILNKYDLSREETLFIDDNYNHIESVDETGVNTLHFIDYDINLEEYLDIIEKH